MKNFTKIMLAGLIVAAPAAHAWTFNGLMHSIGNNLSSLRNRITTVIKNHPYVCGLVSAAVLTGIIYKVSHRLPIKPYSPKPANPEIGGSDQMKSVAQATPEATSNQPVAAELPAVDMKSRSANNAPGFNVLAQADPKREALMMQRVEIAQRYAQVLSEDASAKRRPRRIALKKQLRDIDGKLQDIVAH